ncbi:hypothetical protein L7F22_008623 [Adiantum nelumboides]|nr:hypothetical protein [Adiantum nelumboides]
MSVRCSAAPATPPRRAGCAVVRRRGPPRASRRGRRRRTRRRGGGRVGQVQPQRRAPGVARTGCWAPAAGGHPGRGPAGAGSRAGSRRAGRPTPTRRPPAGHPGRGRAGPRGSAARPGRTTAGQRVDGDDTLGRGQTPREVERGADTRGDPDAADLGHLVGVQDVAADEHTVTGAGSGVRRTDVTSAGAAHGAHDAPSLGGRVSAEHGVGPGPAVRRERAEPRSGVTRPAATAAVPRNTRAIRGPSRADRAPLPRPSDRIGRTPSPSRTDAHRDAAQRATEIHNPAGLHLGDIPLRASRQPGGRAAGSAEDDGPVALDQHPVLQVPPQPAGQHQALDVASPSHHVGRGVPVVDAGDVLLDDRAGVEVGGHVVAGRADQLDPARVRLVVRPRTREGRQEAVVDVDRPPRPRLAQVRGQHLHEPGEDDRVGGVVVDELADLLERGDLALLAGRVAGRGEGYVVERHPVRGDDRLQRRVVADHAGDLHRQLARPHPAEDVVQAVLVAGHQQHGALADAGVGDAVLTAQLGGDRGEPGAELVDTEGDRRGVDDLAGAEHLRLDVGVVGGLGDRGAELGEERADPRDDAGAVRAGQGDHVVGHQEIRERVNWVSAASSCSICPATACSIFAPTSGTLTVTSARIRTSLPPSTSAIRITDRAVAGVPMTFTEPVPS